MLAVKHNIPAIRDRLKRIKILATGGYPADTTVFMERVCDHVARLTPRSKDTQVTNETTGKGGSKQKRHLADGWVVKTIGGSAKGRIATMTVCYNMFTHTQTGRPRKAALLKNADGKKKSYTLLEVLEYGVQPHRKIVPVNAKALHFVTKEGAEVFTKGPINYPGMTPYGMVRQTRTKMNKWAKAFQRKWANKVKRELRRA